MEQRREGSRSLREWQEQEQFGGGAGPIGRATEEGADGIDKRVGWGRGLEGFPHIPRSAIQGGGSGLDPGKGGGVAGAG
jgi:hypothetical protein